MSLRDMPRFASTGRGLCWVCSDEVDPDDPHLDCIDQILGYPVVRWPIEGVHVMDCFLGCGRDADLVIRAHVLSCRCVCRGELF